MSAVEPKLEDPRTLLGQLQRGRGSGFLMALEAEQAEVHNHINHCLTHDPRADRQIEEREQYYAELILRTKMEDFSAIAAHLEIISELSEHARDGWLAEGTLGELAKRGHSTAIQLLRQHVERGTLWEEALSDLAKAPKKAGVAGLDQVVLRRFPGTSLVEESPAWRLPPWKWWRETNPRIAELYELATQKEEPTPPKPRIDRHMTTSKLLSLAETGRWRWRIIGDILAERTSRADVELLLDAGRSSRLWSVFAAFWALGKQGNPAAMSAALDIISAARRTRRFGFRGAAYRYIEQLPPEYTLEAAREWFHSRSWRWQVAGEGVLEHHAVLEDVLMLLKALRAAHRRDGVGRSLYRECSVIDALTHLPEGGPYPELRLSFEETSYSFCRERAARAMAASDQSFPTTYAVECLWDCYGYIKIVGCQCVDLDLPGVRERLREIAQDRYEDRDVRKAAADRLSQS